MGHSTHYRTRLSNQNNENENENKNHIWRAIRRGKMEAKIEKRGEGRFGDSSISIRDYIQVAYDLI